MNTPDLIRHIASLQAGHMAQHLLGRRVQLGKSSEAIAARIGVTAGEFRGWERGFRCPDLAQFIAWMTALGVNGVFSASEVEGAPACPLGAFSDAWIAKVRSDLEQALRETLQPAGPMAAAASVLSFFVPFDAEARD